MYFRVVINLVWLVRFTNGNGNSCLLQPYRKGVTFVEGRAPVPSWHTNYLCLLPAMPPKTPRTAKGKPKRAKDDKGAEDDNRAKAMVDEMILHCESCALENQKANDDMRTPDVYLEDLRKDVKHFATFSEALVVHLVTENEEAHMKADEFATTLVIADNDTGVDSAQPRSSAPLQEGIADSAAVLAPKAADELIIHGNIHKRMRKVASAIQGLHDLNVAPRKGGVSNDQTFKGLSPEITSWTGTHDVLCTSMTRALLFLSVHDPKLTPENKNDLSDLMSKLIPCLKRIEDVMPVQPSATKKARVKEGTPTEDGAQDARGIITRFLAGKEYKDIKPYVSRGKGRGKTCLEATLNWAISPKSRVTDSTKPEVLEEMCLRMGRAVTAHARSDKCHNLTQDEIANQFHECFTKASLYFVCGWNVRSIYFYFVDSFLSGLFRRMGRRMPDPCSPEQFCY